MNLSTPSEADAITATVRVRFAPSPTGALHLGGALVAVANAAFARATGGRLLLRIDDTDPSRSSAAHTDELMRMVRWLGVDWDEGPVHQRERLDVYANAANALLGRGSAYRCFCGEDRLEALDDEQRARHEPPRYDGRCRGLTPDEVEATLATGASYVLRFAVPELRDVEFVDLVHGAVRVPSGSFGDPVILRSDGSSTYLLASVVDDIAFGVTHVLRGDDHLPNTSRQILLIEALGADPASIRFGHLPLLRGDDGRKLSKRDPLGTLDELVDEGYLPVTVRRYLGELLGQGPIDPLAHRGARFRIEKVPVGSPRVDRARLQSLGREDMPQLDLEQLLDGTGVPAIPERAPVVRELAAEHHARVPLRGELRLVFDGPGPADLPVLLRQAGADDPGVAARMDEALGLVVEELRAEIARRGQLPATPDPNGAWAASFIARVRVAARELQLSVRDVLHPLRIALTGLDGGPGLDRILAAIGDREALRRLHLARIALEEAVARGDATIGG